jgi:hypothetical protein
VENTKTFFETYRTDLFIVSNILQKLLKISLGRVYIIHYKQEFLF